MRKIVFLLLMFCVGGVVSAQKQSIVNGNVKHGRANVVNLYEVINGMTKMVKSVEVDDHGQFRIIFTPDKPAFYTVGDDRRNYIIYVKGGESVNIDLLEKRARLTGKNTKENRALYQWEDFVNDVRCDALDNPECTYKEFFPKFTALLTKIDSVKRTIRSGNKAFDQLIRAKIDYDLDYYAAMIIMSPRTVHPKREEWMSYYDTMFSDNKYTSTDILLFPRGFNMFSAYSNFSVIAGAPKKGIEALNNDEMKGEALLFKLHYCKFRSEFDRIMEEMGKYLVTDDQKDRAREIAEKLTSSLAGKPAMNFIYTDVNGKEVSLSDFKGKVVVIDVWASWCAPCKREIPFFKRLEKEMHGQDVVFVGISIDKGKQAWLDCVKQEGLGGVQLWAPDSDELTKFYQIAGIPRFIVIDKKGNVVSESAPSPSSPDMKGMIEKELKK